MLKLQINKMATVVHIENPTRCTSVPNIISYLHDILYLTASSNYTSNNPPHMQNPEAASAVLGS